MARSYAQNYLTIWNDPDFRDISTDAQWLYFTMLTHPTLTSCGVMEWRESRLTAMNRTMTIDRLHGAAWELGEKKLIAVDPETEEALVRSFVRHDGILKSPNKTKALVREHASIASLKLMELVSIEVRRAINEDPNLRGTAEAQPVAKQFTEPRVNPSEWVPERFRKGSNSVPPGRGQKSGKGSESVPPPSSLIPQPLSTDKYGGEDKPRTTRAGRLPKDWHPTPEHHERAKELNINIEIESEKFRNHAEEKGRTSKNWNLAFTNWLIKATEYSPNNQPRNSHAQRPNRVQQNLAVVEQLWAQENQAHETRKEIGQ